MGNNRVGITGFPSPILAVLILPIFFCATPAPGAPSSSYSVKEIRLSGPQEGFYEKANYLVDSSFSIDSGKTMTIAAGSIIRFKKFARVTIRGVLECSGTQNDPVIFTSDVNRFEETLKKPAPFDWNGIEVSGDSARVKLQWVMVTYSTFGIKVESRPDRISLRDVVFNKNGEKNLSIAAKDIMAPDNKAFNYPISIEPPARRLSRPVVLSPAAHLSKSSSIRLGSGLLSGIVLIGGVTAAFVEYGQAQRYADLSRSSRVNIDSDRGKYNSASAGEVFGFITGALGAAGLTLTFAIK